MLDRIERIKQKDCGFLVSSPVNIKYLTGYYFSKEEREAYLFISQDSTTLFTDQRYIEAIVKTIPKSIKATTEKPVNKTINEIAKKEKLKQIYFENNLTYAEYENFKSKIGTKLVLDENFIEEDRMIKDNDEISKMKRAAKLTDKTLEHIKPLIKIGVSEKQIAFEIEMFIKKSGGVLAFDSIVAFGKNSSIPHHATSDKKLLAGDEFVKLDFGAKVDGYSCDMTRTLLTKNASLRAKTIYQTVLDAQSAAIAYINKESSPNGDKAYDVANQHIISKGFHAIPHGLGHGIGLEVHELPHLSKGVDEPLSEGIVFSIEPGIYIPNFGGARIEDTCLYTKGKIQLLTKSPKELTTI